MAVHCKLHAKHVITLLQKKNKLNRKGVLSKEVWSLLLQQDTGRLLSALLDTVSTSGWCTAN